MHKKPYRTSMHVTQTNLAHGLYRNLVSSISYLPCLFCLLFSIFPFTPFYATPNSDTISFIENKQKQNYLSNLYFFLFLFPTAHPHPTPKSYPAGLLEQVWGPRFQERVGRWWATPRDGHAPIDS